MASFLFAFVAVLLIGQGARDQLLMAQLSARLGSAPLVAGIAAAILSACFMAWAGGAIALLLPDSARRMLVGFALIAAAAELALPIRRRVMAEPTRSLAAAFIVLVARQTGDAARFAVFALGAASALPQFVAIGGAAGGICVMAIGKLASQDMLWSSAIRAFRTALAVILLVLGIAIALNARGIIG
jgi:putative Ca2+/H+ antiporter (TMEM165/GDT1 family)